MRAAPLPHGGGGLSPNPDTLEVSPNTQTS
jgi:hypothetical protein